MIILSKPIFAQLGKGYYKNEICFVDIKKDSAHVEIYLDNPYLHPRKLFDEFLFKKKDGNDTIYSGKNAYIIHKRKKYFLFYDSKKTELETATYDDLNKHRDQINQPFYK